MKTMTLVAYNRPHYLAEMLESLRANDCSGYHLFIGIEPGCPEVVGICKAIDFMPKTVVVNDRVLGINNNNFNIIQTAIDAGSEFNVYLEDDIIISKDTIAMANWYSTLPQRNDYLGLIFRKEKGDKQSPFIVEPTKKFHPWGFCFTRYNWNLWFKKVWRMPKEHTKITWDWPLMLIAKNQERLYYLQPSMGRSRTIGREGGTCCTAAYFDRAYASDELYEGPPGEFEFRPLVQGPPDLVEAQG
ncbi:hypothetical protein BVY02_00675 [bacterium J17]|nr:hypothetical protein BVY02_00675 [bacterium J17]